MFKKFFKKKKKEIDVIEEPPVIMSPVDVLTMDELIGYADTLEKLIIAKNGVYDPVRNVSSFYIQTPADDVLSAVRLISDVYDEELLDSYSMLPIMFYTHSGKMIESGRYTTLLARTIKNIYVVHKETKNEIIRGNMVILHSLIVTLIKLYKDDDLIL